MPDSKSTDRNASRMRFSPSISVTDDDLQKQEARPSSYRGGPITGKINALLNPKRPSWRMDYRRRLVITDLVSLLIVTFGTQIAWFGLVDARIVVNESLVPRVSYTFFSLGLVALWMWMLTLLDTRNDRIIGYGFSEYVLIIDASLRLFGGIAIVAFLAQAEVARGYLAVSLPTGIMSLILTRWAWRQWLLRQRRRGECSARVALLGSVQSASYVARELERNKKAGYRVMGACVPTDGTAETLPGTSIPILGDIDSVIPVVQKGHADTVVITSTDELPPNRVKEISWSLEESRHHLIIAPSIADIAGPRIHLRPVSGLPLVHVETPRFTAGQHFSKRALDVILSAIGIALLSPFLALLALIVRIDSKGPVFFRQKRVGYKGKEFSILKFRSMVTNAEDLLHTLSDSRDSGNSIMFKMKDDPRVTRVGKFMRRYSLDELPQLINVFTGSMSLVGPRPPLPSEVAQYASHVHRRFLVKPGITGPWQVSGRSTLSWDETVRLDLSYVENWSMIGDLTILAKTLKVVLAPGETAH